MCTEFMSLFVSRGFSCGSPSHSALFLVQQLTSQPLSVPQCQWDRESGRSLSGDKCSHFQTCGLHRPTLYFQTTVDVLGRGEVRCAKVVLWRCSDDAKWSLFLASPHSEVTLSFQSAPQMNRAPCQRPARFISEAEVRVRGHLAC